MAFAGALELLRIGHQGLGLLAICGAWPFYCTSPSAGSFVACSLIGPWQEDSRSQTSCSSLSCLAAGAVCHE